MDRTTLKRILVAQAKQAGFVVDMIDGIVDDALIQAGPYMWGCYKWKFRRKAANLTLVASQEYVELPYDFSQFYSLRHRNGTSDGWQLTYEGEDTFEYHHPNPTMNSEDEPQSVKIVHDSETGTNLAYFNPIPDSAYTPTLIYFSSFGSIDSIPDDYSKVMLAACWLFMYAPGSDSWMKADIAFNRAKEDAIREIDPMYQGEPSTVKRASRFDPEGAGYAPEDWYKVSDGSDW